MTTIYRVSPEAALDLNALRAAAVALDGAADSAILVIGDDHESGQNAVSLAAWLSPQTTRLRIVAETPVTHTEPFHVATSTATLDFVSEGRAGWSPTVQTRAPAASLTGRRPAAGNDAWREVEDIAEVVGALWTSWEPDAEIRDEATHRFIDRDKVHYVDFTGTDSVGEEFTVKGPSIVPRSPQGTLPTVVTVDTPESVAVAEKITTGPEDSIIVGDRYVSHDGSSGEVVRINDSSGLLTLAAQVSGKEPR
ncbi:MAG: LLM class flavin-dependent oxidoreductase [Mycobacteriaceae bacterium]